MQLFSRCFCTYCLLYWLRQRLCSSDQTNLPPTSKTQGRNPMTDRRQTDVVLHWGWVFFNLHLASLWGLRPHSTDTTTARENNRLSLLHNINTSHVDITIDQYLQRSDPRTRGAQHFRHARTDYPALYHSFYTGTLRQWNRLPTSLSATTCPEALRAGLRALTSAVISSWYYVHHNNNCFKSQEVHTITLLTFHFFY